ncbi:aquaporin Z [Burkholderia singularis]|nr:MULTISPECIES: aquaporin Z [Burkholderia]
MPSAMIQRCSAEVIGTFWLVFGGCGSAVLASVYPETGIGFIGVSLAFGFAMLTMACALGPVSGAHLNPAVSLALALAGRLALRDLVPYLIAQLAGALLGAGAVYLIAAGKPGVDVLASGLAANGYDARSPGQYSMAAAFFTETVCTAGFVLVVLRASARSAPVAAGLALALAYLIAMPVTNASINPARSSGPALIVGGDALKQLWLFWCAPGAGAVLAAALDALVSGGRRTAAGRRVRIGA